MNILLERAITHLSARLLKEQGGRKDDYGDVANAVWAALSLIEWDLSDIDVIDLVEATIALLRN